MPDPASITAHVRALAKPQTAQRAAEALRILSAEEADLGSVVDAGAIPALISVLRDGSDDAKSVAAAALWNISVNDGYKVVIAEAGAISPLISLVRAGSALEQFKAAGALRNLSLNKDNAVAVASAGGIPALVALVKNGNDDGKRFAASALWSLSVLNTNKVTIREEALSDEHDATKGQAAGAVQCLSINVENRVLIHTAGGIPPLVSPRHDRDAFKIRAGALWNLSVNDECKIAIHQAGGIPALVDLLRVSGLVQEKASGALANLACKPDVAVAIVEAGGIPALVAVVSLSNSRVAKEKALRAAFHLAHIDDAHRIAMFEAGSVPPLVAVLRDGNDVMREHAAGILCDMTVIQEAGVACIQAHALPPLVALLREGRGRAKENACGAIENILWDRNDAKDSAVALGAIPLLVAMVRTDGAVSAVAVLRGLCLIEKHRVEIVKAGCIPPLLAVLSAGSDYTKEDAAATLGSLSIEREGQVAVAKAGASLRSSRRTGRQRRGQVDGYAGAEKLTWNNADNEAAVAAARAAAEVAAHKAKTLALEKRIVDLGASSGADRGDRLRLSRDELQARIGEFSRVLNRPNAHGVLARAEAGAALSDLRDEAAELKATLEGDELRRMLWRSAFRRPPPVHARVPLPRLRREGRVVPGL
ncbi:hypothetical protein JL720_6712 [Aureococcus anophagefferens]|nr:hypothetical protein JL720_6712 [Aureococcus anophagefferens]